MPRLKTGNSKNNAVANKAIKAEYILWGAVLIFLAFRREFGYKAVRLKNKDLKNGEPDSIQDISKAYNIFSNHLKKAAAEMIKHGYLKTIQGRYGTPAAPKGGGCG